MAMHPDLILGIDGGGSHTIVVLAEKMNDGMTVGRGESGPSNIQSVGPDAALQALEDAISGAFAAAGHSVGSVAGAALGLAACALPVSDYP